MKSFLLAWMFWNAATAVMAPVSDLRPAAFAPAEGVVQGTPALAPGTSTPLPAADAVTSPLRSENQIPGLPRLPAP